MINNRAQLNQLTPAKRALLAQKIVDRNTNRNQGGFEGIKVDPDPENRYTTFPLTELQQAYWVGRSGAYELGDVAGHSYIELEGSFDLQKLNQAWQSLVRRHDMLRAVITGDGFGQVLESVPDYEIHVHDFSKESADDRENELLTLRHRISHQVLNPAEWPLFKLEAAKLADDKFRLFLGFDALIIDGRSLGILFEEWSKLYFQPDTKLSALELTFRDYVVAERKLTETRDYQRSKTYWKDRVPHLPSGPMLPSKTPSADVDLRFVRRHGFLESVEFEKLKTIAKRFDLTYTVVALAAYCHVVSLWSNSTEFTISVPQHNRLPLHPEVNNIVGEAASFTLLEVKLNAEHSFLESAQKLQARLWKDLDHSLFNGVEILRELTHMQNSGSAVLIPVVFTGSPHDGDGNDCYVNSVASLLGEVVYSVNQTPQVWLDNHISEQRGGLSVDWDAIDELFPEGMQDYMFGAYMKLLQRLSDDEGTWRSKRPEMAASLMPEEQLATRLAMNSNKRDVPEILVQDLFAGMVQRYPENPAVITSSKTLTYLELFELSNQWANKLREYDIAANELIAIVMEKGWEQPVAAHAVLRAGAAYSPIDANQPKERLNMVLLDSRARIVLTQSWLVDQFAWPENVLVFCIDSGDIDEQSSKAPKAIQTPQDLAYVLYTSGSTGNPKGVMIPHRGVVNALISTLESFKVGPEDRVFALTALHHDLSIFDVFGITAAGGAMVIPDAESRRDPDHWAQLMNKHGVTLWNSVPAMMDMMLEYAVIHTDCIPTSLRLAFLGGDWIPINLPANLRLRAENARVVSTGGPTETTLWNIWFPIEEVPEHWSSIPYGKPISNTEYFVLNRDFEHCPDWVVGEMYCAAIGLAAGYWMDEEKTRQKFFAHPRTGQRLYKTEDIGRYNPAGYIEFIGRSDFQVKIQGQRIETGEIEAVLLRHEDISSVIVTILGKAAEKKRLVAYITTAHNQVLSQEQLQEFLSTKIPDYMIPAEFVFLDVLPLTANGKVDRKSLQEIYRHQSVAVVTEASAVAGDVINKLSGIVKSVLGVEQIDVDANLLSLGANSIDMVRIGNQLESEFGFRPRMDQIFKLQTINAISEYCDECIGKTGRKRDTINEIDGNTELKKIIASYGTLRNPEDREAFKESQPGIRDEVYSKCISLEKPDDAVLLDLYRNRYSHRRFGLKPVPFAQFSELCRCVYQLSIDDKHRYLYPSPGGLYATQIYLHVKPGRVSGIPSGTYYYHPVKHELVSHTEGVDLKRDFHVPFVNTPVYDEAAFSVFLVTDLSAVAPSYGELSTFFGKLEAGIMAQLLESTAINIGLGVCQTGGVNFNSIRKLFHLHEGHLFIHAMVFGPVLDEDSGFKVNNKVAEETPSVRAENLIERIQKLTDNEAQLILDETVNSEMQGGNK